MRLLYVCTDFGIDPCGTKGASIHLRAITRGLADLGHELYLVSPHAPPPFDPRVQCIEVKRSSMARESERHLRHWLRDRDLDAAPAKELRSILFCCDALPQVMDSLGPGSVDAILERLSLFGHLGVDLAGVLRVPHFVEVNAVMTEEAARFRSLRMEQLACDIERRALDAADAVIPVSDALAGQLRALGVAANKIHVVPNGVDMGMFDNLPTREACRGPLGLNGAFVAGFSGSLKAWHGVDVLIAAFARLRNDDSDARLLIVGTGPMEAELRAHAQRLGIGEAVLFTGAVDHAAVPRMLRAMDVAVAPYPPHEPFYFSPIKVFEYMASGTCTIASRIGQIPEIIDDGISGLLCAPGSEDELHAAMDRARRAPRLRSDLADAARRTIQARFTWAHTARRVLAVADDHVRGGRPHHLQPGAKTQWSEA
jgi:glycosyltransferase involved in cell wall biosynthesis